MALPVDDVPQRVRENAIEIAADLVREIDGEHRPLACEAAQKLKELHDCVRKLTTARHVDEWHDDLGDVLWWTFPIVEPPHVGCPLNDDWDDLLIFWTPIPIPTNCPKVKK